MARICMMGKRRNEVAHPAEATATGELVGRSGLQYQGKEGAQRGGS